MNSNIIIYESDDGKVKIETQLENETVWLNRSQMAELFDRDVKTIGKHINNIFSEGELEQSSSVANFATLQIEGDRNVERQVQYYNLDVIISVGYRVKSQRGVHFRKWATALIKEKAYLELEKYREKQKQLEKEASLDEIAEDIKRLQENNE